MATRTKILLIHIALNLCTTNMFAQPDSNFVLIHRGTYSVGKKGHLINPLRKVAVKDFYIAKTETTNQQFEKFVSATSYKTDAERMHDALVFQPGLKEFEWVQD